MFKPIISTEFFTRTLTRGEDIDYFIDLKPYALEVLFHTIIPQVSRVQYPAVRALLIRTSPTTSSITIHILQDTDLQSSICNFEVNLSHYIVEVGLTDTCAQLYLSERSVPTC